LDKNQQAKLSISNFWQTLTGQIEPQKPAPRTTVAVIDIDGTIALHYLRTYEIFMRAVKTLDMPEEFKANLANYDPRGYDYYPRKNLLQVGFQEDETLAGMMRFWDENFFSNRYLHLDEPIAGAREFVRILLGLGINIAYLSGRDEQNMGDGTRAWLRRHDFMGDHTRTSLSLKTDPDITSVESKRIAVEKIKSIGEPLLIIDNEPGELEALWLKFPQAATVLLDTPNSGRPGKLPPQTLKIKDFLEINSMYK